MEPKVGFDSTYTVNKLHVVHFSALPYMYMNLVYKVWIDKCYAMIAEWYYQFDNTFKYNKY